MTTINGECLTGVSATTLWTLHNRGSEAKRSDSVIDDPMAAELFDSIQYDYRKFGRPSQAHPLRALAFDQQTRDYLASHPKGSVVALAEGLQTSFWRLDNGELTWYTIDLEPVVELRNNLLPANERVITLAQSALDLSWMDKVDIGAGVLVTAEGLLMYLQPEEALGLIAACAQRFPGGRMVFDNIPHWFSRRTLRGMRLSDRYVAPPMPFAMTSEQATALTTLPGVVSARDVPLPSGRGVWNAKYIRQLDRIGFVRRARPSITVLDFG
ncbi:class I SAM-dependent methyltransferase [Mycobacterium sp. SVM_VP21]|nr:class I SAM-dependent methyltransferase [Mycobacterium sp. SVM_VP21]